MSELKITKKAEGEKITFFIEGRVDTSTSVQLDNEVKPALDGVKKLVMAFENVSYISSSGLRVLLNLHKTMSARGGQLIISKPTEMVIEVFEVTGFIDILNIEK